MSDIDLQAFLTSTSDIIVQYAFSVFGAILLLLGGFILAGLVRRWVVNATTRVGHVDPTIRNFVGNAARYSILIVTFIAVLGQFGVQTASILAALGAAGLAIGLALQGTLQNIAAGLMLLFLRPFKVGEYIEAGSIAGTIDDIGLFATRLTTIDGLYVLAPNSQLWNTPVTNFSRLETRRNDIAIGIGYTDDIGLAERLMMEAAGDDERVLEAPAPRTFVSELGDNAVSVTLRYWTKTSDYFSTGRDLTRSLKSIFDDHNISIPFPQRDIHMIHTGSVPGNADT
ncbi:MAG: mechanosensitive ion channel domain-containing protein [Pseudomonadota bacterium]